MGSLKDQKQQDSRIEDFIESQSTKGGLDERTVRAYRLDLALFCTWLGEQKIPSLDMKAAELYLDYLSREKKLRFSTVTRKYRVLSYFLEYLSRKGQLPVYRPLAPPVPTPIEIETTERAEAAERAKAQRDRILSKAEVDLFFVALGREYDDLDSDFRKRVCLRDWVMMELLFYHGLEISKILRLELHDYDRETGMLLIQGKRDKGSVIQIFSKELRGRLELWIREHKYFERVSEYRDMLFLSKLGKPLSMKMVISIFDKYRIMAGIEKGCTPRDLKKSMERYAKEWMMERCS